MYTTKISTKNYNELCLFMDKYYDLQQKFLWLPLKYVIESYSLCQVQFIFNLLYN